MIKPLTGVRIVEFEGIGPGPLAGKILADLGADVTVISRPSAGILMKKLGGDKENILHRGKKLVTLDLKKHVDREQAKKLIANSDGLIEGNRPGVMERLELGPTDCAPLNPCLAYGRMTGWGQTGPLSGVAGHDLNYVALTGALSLSKSKGGAPIVPPTIVGDAAGAIGLALGMVSALLCIRSGGKGMVVDSAIVDVVAMLSTLALWAKNNGQIGNDASLSIFHDSPFYDVYQCSDGRYITIASIEPQFYELLLRKLELTDVQPADQFMQASWPELKSRIAEKIASDTQAHWCSAFEGTDVCFAPVLNFDESSVHPHMLARGAYARTSDGEMNTAGAPRFLPLCS